LGLPYSGIYQKEAVSIGVIGACDGDSHFMSPLSMPSSSGAVSVAAYCYMSLVPLSASHHEVFYDSGRKKIKWEWSKIRFENDKDCFSFSGDVIGDLLLPKACPFLDDHVGNLMRNVGL